MKILSRGDRIRPGHYAVKARFARSALLLDDANRALFIVDRSIGPGPLNLVVTDPNGFVSGEALVVAKDHASPLFDSSMPRVGRAQLLRVLETSLPRHAPPESLASLFFPAPHPSRFQRNRDALFHAAFAQIAAGRLAAGVRLIRGCGEGLTPSGDDFLCGWMLALRLRRQFAPIRTILNNARGQNPVSNVFLEMSAKGRVNVAVQRLFQCPTNAHVKKVCDFGHSSGADLLCGVLGGLRSRPNPEPDSAPYLATSHQTTRLSAMRYQPKPSSV